MALAAKSFSDLITFTRASTAGYYGSDGLYKTAASGVARTGTYADYKPAELTQQNALMYSSGFDNAAWTKSNGFVQTNLLNYSQDFSNAYWGKSNCTISASAQTAPDGTATASLITANTTAFTYLNISSYVAAATAAINTFVISVMAGTVNSLSLGLYDGTTFGSGSAVIISGPGTLTQQTGSRFLLSGLSTSQWTRVAITRTTVSAGTGLSPFMYPRDQSSSNAGDTLHIWGAQLVQGSVAGDYRATTSAALPILYPDPLGTTLAQKFCEDNAASVQHIPRQTVTLPASSAVTVSVYLKAGERTQARVLNYDGGSNYYGVIVNLLDGSLVSTTSGGTVTNTGYTITAVGSGWYRVTVTATIATAARQFYVNPALVGGAVLYTGDGSSGIYVFGAQLNDGATALPYLATTTTGGHATTTGAKRGFFVEESRTNLVLQSQTFDNASWTKGQSTVSADAATAPDGTTTADKLIVNNTVTLGLSTAAGARQLVSKSAAATTYSWSVYAKAGEFNNVYLFLANSTTTASAVARFDLSSGTVRGAITVAGSFVGVTATAEPIGGGYFRCTLVATSDTDTTIRADIWPGDSTATTGNGTSGIYAWGAQLEAGDKATTYIPTTTAQVTRAVDSARVNTLTPWFSTTGGTFYAEGTVSKYPATLLSMLDAAGYATNSVAVGKLASAPANWSEAAAYNTGGNAALQFDTTAASILKFAFSWDGTNIYAAANGQTTKTAVRALSLANTSGGVRLGEYFFGNMLNAHLRVVRFYPRVYVGTELSGLTA